MLSVLQQITTPYQEVNDLSVLNPERVPRPTLNPVDPVVLRIETEIPIAPQHHIPLIKTRWQTSKFTNRKDNRTPQNNFLIEMFKG